MKDRITIRFNEIEKAELELLMRTHQIENPSEAIKLAISESNTYLKNVSELFFPQNFNVILQRKRKTFHTERKVY